MRSGLPIIVFMINQHGHPDEHCRQEGEDKRLQEGDKYLQQVNKHAPNDNRDGDQQSATDTQGGPCTQDETQKHRQQNVARDHVGKQPNREGEDLGHQADQLDRHEQRCQPQRPGAGPS